MGLSPPGLRQGPCEGVDERDCRIVVHDRRHRKTGPRHPLFVLRCEVHRKSFTVYPPGHVPYGRRPLVVLAPDGGDVDHRVGSGVDRFQETAFEAAIDGAGGKAWRRSESTDYTWCPDRKQMMPRRSDATGPAWSTQKRHLARARHLLGMSANTDDEVVAFAELLDVDALLILEGRSARGLSAESQAVCCVLETLDQNPQNRLLETGARAGLWPSPLVFDPTARGLLHLPFRGRGTLTPQSGSSRIRGDP